MTAPTLRRWAQKEIGACGCAGTCDCAARQRQAIRHYKKGLRAALRAAGCAPAAGGFLGIEAAVRSLDREANEAIRQTRGGGPIR